MIIGKEEFNHVLNAKYERRFDDTIITPLVQNHFIRIKLAETTLFMGPSLLKRNRELGAGMG